MKIAMISPGLLPVPAVKGGAVEVLTEYLVDGNEKHNDYIIDLYTVFDKEVLNYNYSNTNVVFVNIHFITKVKNKMTNLLYKIFHRKKWRTSFNREVIKILKNLEYDLVVIQNNILIYEDIYTKTNNKNNLVYVAHNNVNDGDEIHIRIAKLIGDTAFKILTVSNYTKNNFVEINNSAKIDVLYNCINIQEYINANETDKREELRNKYKLESSDYVFIYSGRIDVHKGVLELIKAFKKINEPDAKLLIVGESWFDGKQVKDEYTSCIKELSDDVRDRIVFTGHIPTSDMPYMYQMSDCLVIPSIWEEPFGVVALEGMISKLPIIATKSGGLVETLKGTSSLLIDKDNNIVEGLKKAMENVLSRKDVYKKNGEENYRKIINNEMYSKDKYFDYFLRKITQE